MKIEAPMEHDAPPDAVHEMTTDPQFQDRKCVVSGARSHTVDVIDEGEHTVVTVVRTMPSDNLPDVLKTFAKGGIKVKETVHWAPPDADGRRIGDLTIEFLGQPLKMRGTITMSPDGDGTAGLVAADLKASVPLLGGKIEKASAPLILEAIATEERVGKEWLADRA